MDSEQDDNKKNSESSDESENHKDNDNNSNSSTDESSDAEYDYQKFLEECILGDNENAEWKKFLPLIKQSLSFEDQDEQVKSLLKTEIKKKNPSKYAKNRDEKNQQEDNVEGPNENEEEVKAGNIISQFKQKEDEEDYECDSNQDQQKNKQTPKLGLGNISQKKVQTTSKMEIENVQQLNQPKKQNQKNLVDELNDTLVYDDKADEKYIKTDLYNYFQVIERRGNGPFDIVVKMTDFYYPICKKSSLINKVIFQSKTDSAFELMKNNTYKSFKKTQFDKAIEKSKLQNECSNLPEDLYKDVEIQNQDQIKQLSLKDFEKIIQEQNIKKSDFFLYYHNLKQAKIENKFNQVNPIFNIIDHQEFYQGIYNQFKLNYAKQNPFECEVEEEAQQNSQIEQGKQSNLNSSIQQSSSQGRPLNLNQQQQQQQQVKQQLIEENKLQRLSSMSSKSGKGEIQQNKDSHNSQKFPINRISEDIGMELEEQHQTLNSENLEQFMNEQKLLKDFFKQKKQYWRQPNDRIINNYYSETGQLFKLKVKRQQKDINKFKLIMQNFDYYNDEIINEGWKKDKKAFNHIEINLADKNFFLPAINGSLKMDPKVLEEYKNVLEQIIIQPQIIDDHRTMVDTILSENKTQQENLSQTLIGNELQPPHSMISAGISANQLSEMVSQQVLNNNNQFTLKQLIEDQKKRLSMEKSKLSHSIIANNFDFNVLNEVATPQYHRFDIRSIIKEKKLINQKLTVIGVQNNKEDLQEKTLQKTKQNNHFDKVNEMVDSYQVFNQCKKLSCRKDLFILFEYIEEHPLILSNVGMASKLHRYIYDSRVLNKIQNNENSKKPTLIRDQLEVPQEGEKTVSYEQELQNFKKLIVEQLGELGKVEFLNAEEKIPNLFGQLTNESIIGISILENNLFIVPVYKQKVPETDFLLVRKDNKFYLRKIAYIFVVGQIEPKQCVLCPQSRDRQTLIKNCINTLIKLKLKQNKEVSIDEVKKQFDYTVNYIKGRIKEYGGVPSVHKANTFELMSSENKQEFENCQQQLEKLHMKPEEICRYERMLNSMYRLKNEFGLQELKTPDKMKAVLNRYLRQNPNNLKGYTIAKLIWDQLNLTSWNLSSSYQSKSKLYLTGIGDPTNGHGGYSFIKKPQKERKEKDEIKEQEKSTKIQLHGTDADYRKLQNKDYIEKLIEFGYDEEYVKKQPRSKLINAFKQAVQSKDLTSESLQKFKRQERITIEMQKDNYQKQINKLFLKLYSYLSSQEIPQSEEEKTSQNQKHLENNNSISNDHSKEDNYNTLEYYMEKEKEHWFQKKQKIDHSAITETEDYKEDIPNQDNDDEKDDGDDSESN